MDFAGVVYKCSWNRNCSAG